MKTSESQNKRLASNRRARHDYDILDTYEGGLCLVGTEVKSVRQGELSLHESYLTIDNGEVFLRGVHIRPYEQGNRFNHDPLRPRKVLLHKHEIRKLASRIAEDRVTLVPLALTLKRGRVKVEIAVARGRRAYDKREQAKKRDAERQAADAVKSHVRRSDGVL